MKQILILFFALAIFGAPAKADWSAMDPARGFGEGAIGCVFGGKNFQCLALRCRDGQTALALIVAGGDFGLGEDIPVYLRIDGAPAVQVRMSPTVMSGTLEAEIVFDPQLHSGLIEDLMRGSVVSVSVWRDDPALAFADGISLRGSSRALSQAKSVCSITAVSTDTTADSYPTPITAPERFESGTGASDPAIETLAREILANDLAQMRLEASKPNIDVESAWSVDFDDGWRFIITIVGASNYHFGFNGFGTVVLAKPAKQEWQQVGPHAPSFWVTLDTEARRDGWPNLIYQSERGENPPFQVWAWDGEKYVLARTIAP